MINVGTTTGSLHLQLQQHGHSSRRDYPAEFVSLKGEIFEVLAISEAKEPAWYYGKTEAGDFGWVSELVLDCEGIEQLKLFIRAYTFLPEPIIEPDAVQPEGCHEDLGLEECHSFGGK